MLGSRLCLDDCEIRRSVSLAMHARMTYIVKKVFSNVHEWGSSRDKDSVRLSRFFIISKKYCYKIYRD